MLSLSCRGDSRSEDAPVLVATPTPDAYIEGDRLYVSYCSQCHGDRGSGTSQGPPFVHRVYEPSHHADASFHRAVQFGVAAHHWRFGNMAPIAGLTREEVTQVVNYVRWLQREAGIF